MSPSPASPRAFTPARWLLPVALVLLGLALFFALGPRTAPVARPSTQEVGP